LLVTEIFFRQIFTMQRYASAVYAIVVCLSVTLVLYQRVVLIVTLVASSESGTELVSSCIRQSVCLCPFVCPVLLEPDLIRQRAASV